jgi:hypothetical protein
MGLADPPTGDFAWTILFYLQITQPGRILYYTNIIMDEGRERDHTSRRGGPPTLPEVEFLEEIQTEVLRVFLLAIHRHLY